MKGCCGKFAGSIKPIWAGLRLIVGWWIEDFEPKALAESRVILEGTDVKFGGGDVNALVGLGITFIGIYVGVNDCCLPLSIGLIFALIDDVNYWGIRESDSRNIYVFDVRYIFLYLWKLFLS